VKKTLWAVKATPIASCLATPEEKALLEGKSVTVTMACTSMGRRNQDKITVMAFARCKAEFSHLCKIGGAGITLPKPVTPVTRFNKALVGSEHLPIQETTSPENPS
jgi:hypothetical protein